MAAPRSRGGLPVGSIPWVNDENAQVERHCEQEVEDFGFSARNELEWLNEHMADVFAKDQINFADILKTPGKLRGKTPRTTRKRNQKDVREPLSTVFSASKAAKGVPLFGSRHASPEKVTSKIHVAEDEPHSPTTKVYKNKNTDSGYHGLTEDEMEVDQDGKSSNEQQVQSDEIELPTTGNNGSDVQTEDRSTTDRSFHSAREDVTRTGVLEPGLPKPSKDEQLDPVQQSASEPQVPSHVEDEEFEDKDLADDLAVSETHSPSQGSSPAQPLIRKSSLTFAALPPRPPLTKKSIGARSSQAGHHEQRASVHQSTFLGRITGSKSVGGSRLFQNDTESGNTLDVAEAPAIEGQESESQSTVTKLHSKSSTQRLHEQINQLGTSQSHRPTKSNAVAGTRPSVIKSTHDKPAAAIAEALPPTDNPSRPTKNGQTHVQVDEEEEDWIQSPKMAAKAPERPVLPKNNTTDVMEGIGYHKPEDDQIQGAQRNLTTNTKVSSPLPQTVPHKPEGAQFRVASDSRTASPGIYSSYDGVRTFDGEEPKNRPHIASTTPIGSPFANRHPDGPLSASKSKLQSIMKTARGLFSSSAGVSAQAKMETLQNEILESTRPLDHFTDQDEPNEPFAQADTNEATAMSEAEASDEGNWTTYPSAPKTRSSTEKEKRKQQEDAQGHRSTQNAPAADAAASLRSKNELHTRPNAKPMNPAQPAKRPLRHSPRKAQVPESHSDAPQIQEAHGAPDVPPAQAQGRPAQNQRSKEPRRPIRPNKDNASKSKPQPVAIRVGMPSAHRMPLNNGVLSSTLSESLPPPQPKQPALNKKPSLQSSTSNSNLKSSVNSSAPKPPALLAAERKKKQDEKEAQRKLEQKRDIERRRAAQQEESRRQEQFQRQEAEKQREREKVVAAEEAKKNAQRQAMEKKRADAARRDQPRMPQRAPEQANATSRPEAAGMRPPSRQHNPPESIRPVNSQLASSHPKQAIKRVFEPEGEPQPQRARPLQGPVGYQPNENKRRKTEEEEPEEFPMRPTHVPPIRNSVIRKEVPKSSSIFANSYSMAPPPAAHHHNGPPAPKAAPSMQAYTQHSHQAPGSRPGNHPNIGQYANGKIPFAEHPNPPSQQQQHPGQPAPSHLKTPGYSKAANASNNPGRDPQQQNKPFSPQYPNGENIHLDEIPTDSEEFDSDDEDAKPKPANLPEWAQSPHLRQLLETQDDQLDADAVFGPVATPRIEEMFKERHHRFRSRTSSANWSGSDRLTEEEIRRDVEARQRLRRDGGWTYGL